MKVRTIMTALSVLFFSQLGFAQLQNFDDLHTYYKNEFKIKQGSFQGWGEQSQKEYQLTLLQYSEEAPHTFVLFLERLTEEYDTEQVGTYFTTLTSDTQADFFEFVLSNDRTMYLPPFEGAPQMTLNLHQLEDNEMMLELKPLTEDAVLGEIVKFKSGRSPQIYRSFKHMQFTRGEDGLLMREDDQGVWAELSLEGKPNASGTYRVANEGIPGLFTMRKIVKDRYGQYESDEIAYVIYFSRRVTPRGFFDGPFYLGKYSTRYATTVPFLSDDVWEMRKGDLE